MSGKGDIKGDRRLQMYTVDSFTSVAFCGNPSGVCLDDTEGLSEELMQKIAAEMNISETAFVRNLNSNSSFKTGNEFGLRWFTPTVEVPLCGHGTLATAAVLVNIIGNTNKQLKFNTLSGTLNAEALDSKIVLDLPSNAPEPVDRGQFERVIKAVVGDLQVQEVLKTHGKFPGLVIRLADKYTRSDVMSINPDFSWLQNPSNNVQLDGVMITLKGRPDNGCVDAEGKQFDFVSRFFAPWLGINEDPTTGAAHTTLGPYWSQVLGKKQLYANQCSKRGGHLWLTIRDDGRINVAGHSTVVLQGSFMY